MRNSLGVKEGQNSVAQSLTLDNTIDKHSSAYLGMATVHSVTVKSVTKRSPHYSAMEQQNQTLIAWLNSPIFVLCVNVF